MKKKLNKSKLAIIILVIVMFVGVISTLIVVVGKSVGGNNPIYDPHLKNTSQTHEMINKDVQDFIEINYWTTDKEGKTPIGLSTAPQNYSSKYGVVLHQDGSFFSWKVKILLKDTLKIYKIINLGDPKNENKLKDIIKTPKTWNQDKDKQLYLWPQTPYLDNNNITRELINKDAMNYINNHEWYTSSDWKAKTTIETVPNRDNNNAGVKWITDGIHAYWTIDIIIDITTPGGGKDPLYDLNLANPKNEDELTQIIQNRKIWEAISLYATDFSHLLNTAGTKTLINDEVVHWLHGNLWYHDEDRRVPISLDTIGNYYHNHDGVDLVINSDSTLSWKIVILYLCGNTWVTFTTLDLGNPKNKNELIAKIQNSNTWQRQTPPNRDLYAIHYVTTIIIVEFYNKLMVKYLIWTRPGEPELYKLALLPQKNAPYGIIRNGYVFTLYILPYNIKTGAKRPVATIELTWKTVFDINESDIINAMYKGYLYLPNN